MKRAAILAGSFDPITLGHLNIIKRGLAIFDRIVVAVAINSSKTPIFSVAERIGLLTQLFKKEPRIEIDSFEGLLADYCQRRKIYTLVRGIRNTSDFEYETAMAVANRTLNPKLVTVFLGSDPKLMHLSSTLIKEIVKFGGSVRGMVPGSVAAKLKEKLAP